VATSEATVAAPGTAVAGLRGRVLLVEDNSVNRIVGAAMLQQLGLEVVLAEHGEEALAVLREQTVNLVLMDCQMPVMDGYEATQRIREIERNTARPRLPVIALTANALSGDFDRCLAAGMDAYLSKPYTRAQMHATLAPWLDEGTAAARGS
jgi:CheY-like chemotaxis protein